MLPFDPWHREKLRTRDSHSRGIAGLLLGFLALLVPTVVIADKNDCKSFKPGSKEYRACIEQIDKRNHKNARTVVIDKPTQFRGNVTSKKDAQREIYSKKKKPLHFTKDKYASKKDAKEELHLSKTPRGAYTATLPRGDTVKSTKLAGGDGRKREYLIDRNTVKKRTGNDLHYERYKK